MPEDPDEIIWDHSIQVLTRQENRQTLSEAPPWVAEVAPYLPTLGFQYAAVIGG